MNKVDILILKLENQIDALISTQADIDKETLNGDIPRHMSQFHKVALSMVNQCMLMRCLWDKLEELNLNQDQSLELVGEIAKTTADNLKLYGFDPKGDIN